MKIFAIRDESSVDKNDLGYLLYYEKEKRFYIELPEDADPWDTPLLLSSLLKKGQKSINSYWSKIWVQQRIVPTDRQNIGQILKKYHLSEYDEFDLLMIAKGRCAQDDYYLSPISREHLPKDIRQRFLTKIEDLIPLADQNLLVFFSNGKVKKCSLRQYFSDNRQFGILLKKDSFFENVKIQAGGYGVSWGENLMLSDQFLYELGRTIPLTLSDFENFVRMRVVTSSEAAEYLNCSRQYLDEMRKKDKLHPIKATGKTFLYSKSELTKINWE